MSDFRQKIIESLGMKLRKNQTEFTDGEILRRVDTIQHAYQRAVERQTQLEVRFKVLSELAGEDATEQALAATPSDEKMELLRWLDPTGDDFLGSGMTLEDYLTKRNIQEFGRNIASQMRDEQQRRMDLIIRLAVEYDHIRKTDLHGVMWLEEAIEDMIRGEPEERFEEKIGFMLDSKMRGPAGRLTDEEQARWDAVWNERMRLWAPAIAICREFTGAFQPPPEDRPRYSTWQEMVEKEPGMIEVGKDEHDNPVWMMEKDAHLWDSLLNPWQVFAFRAGPKFWEQVFNLDVRWRGPRRSDEHGYWHREDGERFPDDPEKFWGNNYYRIYRERDLGSWQYRQKDN